MGDWDFLYDLTGEELIEAQATGGTEWDWKYIDEHYDRPQQHKNAGNVNSRNAKKR